MPSREQRVRVWRGELKKTTGGLTKDDLVKNRKGKIVSRRKSRQAADQNNLGEWLRNKGDRFQDMPQAHAAKGLKAPKPRPPKPVPEPKRERPPAPKKLPKKKKRYEEDEDWQPPKAKQPKPKALMPKPPRPLPKPRGVGSSAPRHPVKQPKPRPKVQVLKDKPKPKVLKAKVKLHAREPQPEYVRFREDLGHTKLRKAPEPAELYPVRKALVESAPIAPTSKRFGVKHGELSVRNIRRSSRRKKKVDYSKFY